MDETIATILKLERWQATPSLLLIKDRSAELSNAKSRLTDLAHVLTSP